MGAASNKQTLSESSVNDIATETATKSKNFDTLVLSWQTADSLAFTRNRNDMDAINVSKENEDYIWDAIDDINVKLMCDTLTDDELAAHFADFGKRLDDAYASGKYTESEYNELNAALDNYMKVMTSSVEETRAIHKMGYEHGQLSPRQGYEQYLYMSKMTEQERIEDKKNAIQAYIDRYTRIDRDNLLSLVNSLRYNTDTKA
jgi:hypothetical protein